MSICDINGHHIRPTGSLFVDVDAVQLLVVKDEATVIDFRSGRKVVFLRPLVFHEAPALSSPVKEIGPIAFRGSAVESLFIPRNVELIGPKCFCRSLTAISFQFGSE